MLAGIKKEFALVAPGPNERVMNEAKVIAQAYATLGESEKAEEILKEAGDKSLIPTASRITVGDLLVRRDVITEGGTPRVPRPAAGTSAEPARPEVRGPKVNEANTMEVMAAGLKSRFALGQPDTVSKLQTALYVTRVDAKSIPALRTHPEIFNNQSAFIPHYYYYVIPMCIGDTCYQLGIFDKALENYGLVTQYPYLNKPVEIPNLWIKMARTHLAWGDALYRNNDREGAKAHYESVLSNGQVPSDSSLYQGLFFPMQARIQNIIANRPALLEPRDIENLEMNPMMVAIIIDVSQRLAQLTGNLNALGFPDNYVPVMSFEYLQGVARAFAQFAAQANREYISFKQRAEDESFTIIQMEQAVNLSYKGWQIENQHNAAAREEREAAEAAEKLAKKRRELAEDNLSDYQDLGWEIVRLEEGLAWANASAVDRDDQVNLRYEGLEDLGIRFRTETVETFIGPITVEEHRRRNVVIQEMTRARAERSYQLEKGRLENNVAELEEAEKVAKAQREAAQAREKAAGMAADAAMWRWIYSQSNLNYLRNQEINADIYNELAGIVKETAQIYLRRAIEIAFLMEQAYEFENGVEVNRIRFDYGDLAVADGLYAADLLLRDIDYFTYHKLLTARAKAQPASRVTSLATEYPLQFMLLRRDGKMHFTTHLTDFQKNHPGIYNGRIKQVEIIVEGLVGSLGPIGSLACAGVSKFRRVNGEILNKVHPPETLLLSDYRPRRDALVADVPSAQLRIFENIGLETDWLLTFPKSRNDFDFNNLTDVKIVISYLCEHDQILEEDDVASLPVMEESRIWYSMKYDFAPDAFYLLADTGRMDFGITADMLAFNQTNPSISGISLLVISRENASLPLTVKLWSYAFGNSNDVYSANADGVIVIQSPDQTDRYKGKTVLTNWHLTIDPSQNAELQPDANATAKLDLRNIRDIIFVVQYQYGRA
jgi:hypothetical protein